MAKKPNIRFAGFEDDWEQRKFSDVGSVAMCKRIFKEQTSDEGEVPFYKIGTFGGEPDAFISRELFDEYKTKYPYPNKGDILISASGSIGRTVEFTGKNEYFQDSNIVWLKHGNEIDNSFLKVLYSVVEWSCEGSTIKRLYNDNFLKTNFMLPKIDEQIKLGAYFSALDHLITLHQRKCEEMKKLKKYMLQKTFPKNGMAVPEIRFDGFTDDWEQRKLGEACQEFKSGNSLKADQIDTAGDYPVYGGNGLRGYTSTYNHDGEFALIGRQGALCGNMNYSVGKAYFTEHAVVVDADENNDTKFLYYMLDTMNLGQYSDKSAQPGLAVNKLVKLENLFPKKEEQRRIGRYYSTIDHLITLHQRKCEELQKLKKFMLQNMFV